MNDITERAAKRQALEDFYGGEVPDHMVDRIDVRDIGPDPVVRSVN